MESRNPSISVHHNSAWGELKHYTYSPGHKPSTSRWYGVCRLHTEEGCTSNMCGNNVAEMHCATFILQWMLWANSLHSCLPGRSYPTHVQSLTPSYVTSNKQPLKTTSKHPALPLPATPSSQAQCQCNNVLAPFSFHLKLHFLSRGRSPKFGLTQKHPHTHIHTPLNTYPTLGRHQGLREPWFYKEQLPGHRSSAGLSSLCLFPVFHPVYV